MRASVRAHSPALSPSSPPVISLPHPSAAAPRLRPESNQDSHLYPACHARGCWAGGVGVPGSDSPRQSLPSNRGLGRPGGAAGFHGLPITGTSRAAYGKGIGCHEEDIPLEPSRSPQKEPSAYYTHFSM